jgi:hypothetical protein
VLTRSLVVAALVAVVSPAIAEPRLGVTVDAGVPDGASASIVFRPVSRIRLHAGATHNLVSQGTRVGITLAPLRTWLSPTLNFDYGRYRDGDANVIVRTVTGDPTFSSSVLDKFGYSYANAHLGLEFGRERATFYIHAGASYIATRLRGLDAAAADGSTMVTFTVDPSVTLWSVSARIGLIVYFL